MKRIKWSLYLNAVQEGYLISWALLRMRSENQSPQCIQKQSIGIRQRKVGYLRVRKRKLISKLESPITSAKRFLLNRIPIS